MNETYLAAMLRDWFKQNETNDYKWCRNEVGKVIKKEMKLLGNWRRGKNKSDDLI